MKNRYIACIIISMCMSFFSCKKNNDQKVIELPATFTIEKLSREFVQSGDSLTVYGSRMVQEDFNTEVFINDKPAAIIKQSADSITINVPDKVQTGKIRLTLSSDGHFSSVNGPSVEVRPTPVIKGYWPLNAYGGDTIELYTEHFSTVDKENSVLLGNSQLEIISRRGADTILVRLAEKVVTGPLSWRTYDGPVLKMDVNYPVRQMGYNVDVVGEWLEKDPGFSFMDTLVRGFPALAENYEYHKRIYDVALSYIYSPDSTYTIFLSNDNGYYENKVSKADFIQNLIKRPYNYNTLLIAGITPGNTVHLNNIHDGDTLHSAYTYKMQWEVGNEDDRNYIKISNEGGQWYAQIVGLYEETRPKVKIIREHHIGNATIIELAGELGYVPM